jgi:hypothetical protein
MVSLAATARRLRRRLRYRIEAGDYVYLSREVTLPNAIAAPAGTYARVVRIEPDGRYLVEVTGFAGAGEAARLGSLGRVSVAREALRPGWFPSWWRQRPL